MEGPPEPHEQLKRQGHLSQFFCANDYIDLYIFMDYIGLYKKGTVEKLRRLFCLGHRRRVSILGRWVLKDLRRQSCIGTC